MCECWNDEVRSCHNAIMIAWLKVPRNKGGLGALNIPLIADIKRTMTYDYGCMMAEGHPSRGPFSLALPIPPSSVNVSCHDYVPMVCIPIALFIIDPKGIVRHMQQGDPPVGRSSEEILRIVQAFQVLSPSIYYPSFCLLPLMTSVVLA
jgi:peroxiredoxin (alkyl hydroperoxide reductase subunit C)